MTELIGTQGIVTAVSRSSAHTFSKQACDSVRLLAHLGVESDANLGTTTRHRHLIRKDPTRLNLTQVHLLHSELFDHLRPLGFNLLPGLLGENITTRNIDLHALPTATRLCLGSEAVVEITGYRTPCSQMDKLQPGLMTACFTTNHQGRKFPVAGIMGIVLTSGDVRPGDAIRIHLPPQPYHPLKAV